jgi:hypothetical protein
MGVIERLVISWKGASFAAVVSFAWLSAWLVACPHVGVNSWTKACVGLTAEMPSRGCIMASIEDDDRRSQDDDLEPCGLPGVQLASASSPPFSQMMPPPSVSLSTLIPAQHPLRC